MNLPLKSTQLAGPLIVLLIAVCFYLLEPNSSNWFQYDRQLIEQHQFWRLLSANFLHTNFNHLLLNLSGLTLLWALHGDYYRTSTYLFVFSFCGLCCTAGIYWWVPDMLWYVGLSGVLHGLLVWGAAKDIQQKMTSGWLLMLAVWLKIGYEQIIGPNIQLADLIEANIATSAHLFGAIGGLLWIIFSLAGKQNRSS